VTEIREAGVAALELGFMTSTMDLPVPLYLSFVEDDVSSRKTALSATLTSCSFLTTLLTMSSLVTISIANEGGSEEATEDACEDSEANFSSTCSSFLLSKRGPSARGQ
jgi:hypothetical protein